MAAPGSPGTRQKGPSARLGRYRTKLDHRPARPAAKGCKRPLQMPRKFSCKRPLQTFRTIARKPVPVLGLHCKRRLQVSECLQFAIPPPLTKGGGCKHIATVGRLDAVRQSQRRWGQRLPAGFHVANLLRNCSLAGCVAQHVDCQIGAPKSSDCSGRPDRQFRNAKTASRRQAAMRSELSPLELQMADRPAIRQKRSAPPRPPERKRSPHSRAAGRRRTPPGAMASRPA